MGIIFFPGLLLLPAWASASLTEKRWSYVVFGIVITLTYPLAMIVAEICLLLLTLKVRELDKEMNKALNKEGFEHSIVEVYSPPRVN